MAERIEAARRPARAPLPRRSRKRWAAAAGIAVGWVVLLAVTGSPVGSAVVLVVIGGLAVMSVLGLRALGVTRDHPWVRQMAARPWRDGQDVLQLALRHLPEVFLITPSGSLLAPSAVEVQLNPEDLVSLCERMDISLISMSATEVYQEQVAAHAARLAGPGPPDVRVVASPAVAPGRYQLRQGQPVRPDQQPGYADPALMVPGPELAYAAPPPAAGFGRGPDGPPYPNFTAHDGRTRAEPGPFAAAGGPTALESACRPVPRLRLVTGDSVTETAVSGARAGRGDVELGLPEVATVSREHARFTFSGGQWWIANLGRNGLTVNSVPVAGECPLGQGDVIGWGTRPDALRSWVEIG